MAGDPEKAIPDLERIPELRLGSSTEHDLVAAIAIPPVMWLNVVFELDQPDAMVELCCFLG